MQVIEIEIPRQKCEMKIWSNIIPFHYSTAADVVSQGMTIINKN